MRLCGTVGQTTDDDIIWRVLIACWVTKATDTHSLYAILIAFPRQIWLRERALVLRYTYLACLVSSEFARIRSNSPVYWLVFI